MEERMHKSQLTLTQQQIKELNAIERETDRPRTRIIRRAVEDYLMKYRAANPEFAAKFPRTPEASNFEREFKPGVETDFIAVRGKRTEVVVTPDGGWRLPTEEDYVKDEVQTSIFEEVK